MESGFFQQVYEIVQKIPVGCVATYGQIARLCGNPRASRAVGYALHVNPLPGEIPCHRVVNRFGGAWRPRSRSARGRARKLLTAEGVSFSDEYTVSLDKHLWDPFG